MSPRSDEYMVEAHNRLAAGRAVLAAGLGSAAVGSAYYATLYAARAALSEEEHHARTHRGTWRLFRETFVVTGRFDRELLRRAERRQELREAADYDARQFSGEEAGTAVAGAEAFVEAVGRMLAS